MEIPIPWGRLSQQPDCPSGETPVSLFTPIRAVTSVPTEVPCPGSRPLSCSYQLLPLSFVLRVLGRSLTFGLSEPPLPYLERGLRMSCTTNPLGGSFELL